MKFNSILFCLVLCTNLVDAQKTGFVDMDILKDAMPECRALEEPLDMYERLLMKSINEKREELIETYDLLSRGCWFNKKAYEKVIADFEVEEKALEEEIKAVPEKLKIRKAKLMEPILNKIDVAVQAISSEEGYDEIYDIKELGEFYYLDKQYDITEKVRLRLGL